VIYLDSSALLKLIFEEPESAALEVWLSSRGSVPKVSSELAKVEVLRASRRMAPDTVPAAVTMLSQLDLVPLSGGVIEQAAYLDETSLRGLDALHLASAVTLGSGPDRLHRLRPLVVRRRVRPRTRGAPTGCVTVAVIDPLTVPLLRGAEHPARTTHIVGVARGSWPVRAR